MTRTVCSQKTPVALVMTLTLFATIHASAAPIPPSVVRRIQSTPSAPVAGERVMKHLDLDGDGRITAADAVWWKALAEAFRKASRAAHLDVTPAAGIYAPEVGTDTAFAGVHSHADSFDVSRVGAERLLEATVESRWIAQQVALVSNGYAATDFPVGGTLAPSLSGYTSSAMSPEALCTALETLDVQAYADAGLTPTAVFDLDGTVWNGHIMSPFLNAVVASGRIRDEVAPDLRTLLAGLKGISPRTVRDLPADAITKTLAQRWNNRDLPRAARPSGKEMFIALIQMLRGQPVKETKALARTLLTQRYTPHPPWRERVFAAEGCSMVDVANLLRARGVKLYALSASLGLLAEVGATLLDIPSSHVMGARLAVKNGRYTGQLSEGTYWSKASLVRQWLPSPPALVFGDSANSDFGMLQQAMVAGFMVNPGQALETRDEDEADYRLVALKFDGMVGPEVRTP